MQQKALILVALALAISTRAQDIDDNDVPGECRSLCNPVTSLTQQCDAQNDDDDDGYINCVCNYQDASSLVPACEACVAVYDESDNDVYDIVSSCGFSSAQYTPGATIAPTATVPATNTAASPMITPNPTDNGDDDNDDDGEDEDGDDDCDNYDDGNDVCLDSSTFSSVGTPFVPTTRTTTYTSSDSTVTTTIVTDMAATTGAMEPTDNVAPVVTMAPFAGAGVVVLMAGLL